MNYRIQYFAPGACHVVDENNHPVYDDVPYGKDAPTIFRDEDQAIEFCDQLNNPQVDAPEDC